MAASWSVLSPGTGKRSPRDCVLRRSGVGVAVPCSARGPRRRVVGHSDGARRRPCGGGGRVRGCARPERVAGALDCLADHRCCVPCHDGLRQAWRLLRDRWVLRSSREVSMRVLGLVLSTLLLLSLPSHVMSRTAYLAPARQSLATDVVAEPESVVVSPESPADRLPLATRIRRMFPSTDCSSWNVTTRASYRRRVRRERFEWPLGDCIPGSPWTGGSLRFGNRLRRTFGCGSTRRLSA